MWFVVVGVVLIILNLAGVQPVGSWTWRVTGDLWKFAVPFLLAVVWWGWADKSGLNKRREIERMEAKKRERRKANLAALGMGPSARRKHPR